MSKNEVTLFADSGALVVPDYINEALEGRTNLTGRKTVPSLLFEGKVWQYSVNGERHQITGKNTEGDIVPVQVLRVCIIGHNEHRGRTFYEGTYDPNKPGAPRCWSDDGVQPHANVQSPCAVSCKSCPNSVKGSKVSVQGTAAAACGQYRLLSVIPMSKLDIGPLRMKISGTSDYEKDEKLAAQKWFGFSAYKDYIKVRGINHTSAIVTKLMFDPNVPYPKPLFSAERFVTPDEMAKIKPYFDTDELRTALNIMPQEGAGAPRLTLEPRRPAVVAEMPVIESKVIQAAAAQAAVEEEEDEVPAAKPAAKVKQTKKAAPAAQVVEAEPQAVVKSPSASPKAGSVVDPSLEAILDDWGE